MDVRIKRIYEPAEDADGCRVLVDRLWPRGISKSRAALTQWQKDAAPSSGLRKSWHADPEQYTEVSFSTFADSYRNELSQPPGSQAVDHLCRLPRDNGRLTLVYGAKDSQYNHAHVLLAVLQETLQPDEHSKVGKPTA